MTSKLLLRIAFGLILFHLLGHSVGHFTWRETKDPTLTDLIQKMDTYKFDFMGTPQTLGGHHEGYSTMLGITLIMLAVVTWLMSGKIGNTPQLKGTILTIGVFFLVFGVIEAIYFFPLPGITSILVGIFYFLAFWRVKS
jgi:hypothetical protein